MYRIVWYFAVVLVLPGPIESLVAQPGTSAPDVEKEMRLRSEFVFDDAPFVSCHASTIVEVERNTLLVAYFAGSAEGESDVAIWCSRGVTQADGETDWSAPVKTAKHQDVPCWNPVLHKTRKGELLLFYKAGPNPQGWSGFLKRSRDGGRTWSETGMLPAGILGPIKNKPIELTDGRIVCGSSVESYQAWSCWIEITPDGGRNWSKHGPINVPGELFGIIQPTIFETSTGAMRILCRSTEHIGKICESSSTDGGRTWSPAKPIELPNPNSGIDAVRLTDGKIILVYNHAIDARSPLNVAYSKDDGIHFQPWFELETEPDEFSYPAVIQTTDGRIHTTYTFKRKNIKHVSFDALR